MADRLLDAKGLRCPLPILKTRKALADMGVGETLEVLTTDPAAPSDFAAFCRTTGNELIEETLTDGVRRFVLRRAG